MADLQIDVVPTESVEIENRTSTIERKAKFVFNTVCFCIPLRIGCFILAYSFLIGNVLAGIWAIVEMITMVKKMTGIPIEYRYPLYNSILVYNAISLLLLGISLPHYIVLFTGLHKERRDFMMYFETYQQIYITVNILRHIVYLAIGYTEFIFIATIVASDVLNIYYVLVLRSWQEKMGETINKLPRQLYRDGHVEIIT